MGFSANSLGRLNLEIGYTVDKSGLRNIQTSLNEIMNMSDKPGQKMTQGLQTAQNAAKQLSGIIGASIDQMGNLDISRFATTLKSTGTTMGQIQSSMQTAGVQGQAAFSQINSELLKTQTTASKVDGVIGQIGKTFANTLMYSMSYRIVGGFISGVQSALSYVKDLDKSLTDIQIVTKENNAQMEQFAQKANAAAKSLGVSTNEYAKASLIFTQQGLKGKERDVKTETTMKVANVTGDDAAEVSQNLTAVWNGYKVNSEEAEAAIDKLANVAAHSASNLAELSTGMSKVASAANTMGVSEDQLVSQLSTIESVTRQAPESIGTALKTIYARMGDLQVEGTDEFGVSLGEVSNKLKTMGIDILDQEGNMREMGQVMEEVAEKWGTWTQAQQQAAAVAMAGKRQYNNLMSLFSNWDMYEQNMEYSQNSEGEIEAQQEIYLQSIEGLQNKAKASWEAVYQGLFDSDYLKGFYEVVAGIGDAFSSMGDMLPIAGFALIGTLLQDKIVSGLTNVTLGLTSWQQQNNVIAMQEQAIAAAQQGDLYIAEGKLDLARNLGNVEKDRVLTNQEIFAAGKQNSAVYSQMNMDIIAARREETALAEGKKQLLSLQENLTEAEQANYQMKIEELATLEKESAMDMERVHSVQSLLGISNQQLEQAMQEENAEAEIANILKEKQGLIDQTYEAISNVQLAEQDILDLETIIKDKSLEKNSEYARAVELKKQIVAAVDDETLAEELITNATKQGLTSKAQLLGYVKNISTETGKTAYNMETYKTKVDSAKASMGQLGEKAMNVSRTSEMFKGLTSGMFGISMLASSWKGLMESLKDPNTSGVEKITAALMNLAMVGMSLKQLGGALKGIGLAFSGFKAQAVGISAVETALKGTNVELAKETKTSISNTLAAMTSGKIKKDEAKARLDVVLATEVEDKTERKNLITKLLGAEAEEAKNVGLGKAIVLQWQKVVANIAEFASAHPLLMITLAIGAALTALIIAYVNSESAQEKHNKALKKSQKNLAEEREMLTETKKRYDELRESISNLESSYAKLNSLTKGTKEWKEQVIEVNNQVLELMKNYPELAKYVSREDGVLHISDEGLNQVLKQTEKAVHSQEANVLTSQAEVASRKQSVATDQAGDIVRNKEDFVSSDDAMAATIGLGVAAAVSAAFLPVVGPIMLGVAALATWVKAEAEENEADQVSAVIQGLAETGEYNDITDIREAVAEESDRDYTDEELGEMLTKVEELRQLNAEQLIQLKEAGAAQREALDIQFSSEKEGDEGEKEIEAKNSAFDATYAARMKKMQDNDEIITATRGKEIVYISADQVGEYKNQGYNIDRTGEYRSQGNDDSDEDIFGEMNEYYNIFHGIDTDEDTTGENENTKVYQNDLTNALEEMNGDQNLSKVQKDYIKENYKTSADIGTVHWVAQESGIDQASLKWDAEQNAVVDEQGNVIKQFEDVSDAARYNEKEIMKDVASQVDYESIDALSEQEANYYANAGQNDVDNMDISKLTADDVARGITSDLREALEKNGFTDEQIEKLEKNTQEAYDAAYASMSEGAKKLLNTQNITVEQAKNAEQYLQYEKRYNENRKKNEAESTVISDLYEKNTDKIDKIQEALSSIDWSEEMSVDELKAKLHDYGLEADELGINLKDLITTMKDCSVGVTDLNTNMDDLLGTMTSYLQKVQDLKPGDALSAEDYEAAKAAAKDPEAFAKLFYYDPKKNKYVAKQSSDPNKSFEQLRDEAYLGNIKEQTEDLNTRQKLFADRNVGDKKLQSYKFTKDKTKNEDVTKDIIKNLDDEQLKYLKQANGGQYAELINKIRKDPDADIPDEFKKLMTDLTGTLQTMGTEAREGKWDTSSAAYLQQRLQTENKTAQEAYADSRATADQDSANVQQAQADATAAMGSDMAIALGDTQENFANFQKQVLSTSGALEGCSEALKNVATSNLYTYYRLTQNLADLWNNKYKDAKRGSQEWANLMSETASNLSTAYGVPVDNEFVEKNADLIKKAASKGGLKARKELDKIMGREYIKAKFKIDLDKNEYKKTKATYNKLKTEMADLDVEFGAKLNGKKFADLRNKLLKFINSINLSAKAAGQLMSEVFDVDAKFTGKKGKLKFAKGEDITFIGDIDDANTEAAAAAGANDSSNSGNNPTKQYEVIDKNDIDKLHDLKQALEDLNKALEALKKIQDRVFGKSLIENLERQNKLIKQQAKNVKEQISIQTKELGQSQTDMEKLFGFKFNKKTGRISNYEKVINKYYKDYRDLTKKYNNMGKVAQNGAKGQKLKTEIDTAKTKWGDAKTAVSDYDSLFNERQSNLNNVIEYYNTIADNNLKKLTAMSEAIKKVNELQKVYLDFQKDVINSEKDRAAATEYNYNNAKLTEKQLKADDESLKKLSKRLAKMKRDGWSKKDFLNFTGLTDKTKEMAKAVADDIKAISDSLVDTVQQAINAYKDYEEAIDKIDSKYKHLINTLKSYEEITKLLYGDDEYQTFVNLDEEAIQVYDAQLFTAITKRNEAEKELADAQELYDKHRLKNAGKVNDKLEERLKQAETNWQKACENVNTVTKDLLNSIKEAYNNTIKNIYKEVSDSLTSGYGWDVISESLKRDKQYSDDWLDSAQKIGNIAELTAQFEQEIAKAVNYSASAQQKLLMCKQEELATLEKIDKLTQADIDRAKARLSLTLKEIALEEARENKSKLRLKRDTQGNYSYQYSVDQEAIAKAKEEYEAARLKLLEDTQKELFRLQQAKETLEKETIEKIQKLELERATLKPEEQQKVDKQINDILQYSYQQSQNLDAGISRYQKYLGEEGLSYYNKARNKHYSSVQEAFTFDKTDFENFLFGSEGLVPRSDTGFKAMEHDATQWGEAIRQATLQGRKEWKKYSNRILKVAEVADASLRLIIMGSDDTSGLVNASAKTEELRKQTTKVTKAYEKQRKEINRNIKRLNKLLGRYLSDDMVSTIANVSSLAEGLENVKANTKAAMKYIMNNADTVITKTSNMSDAAHDLAEKWREVEQAAKDAIDAANEANSGASPDDSPFGKPEKKKKSAAYKKSLGVIQQGGKWYVVDQRNMQNQAGYDKGGNPKSFETKEAALKAAKKIYKKASKKTRKKWKLPSTEPKITTATNNIVEQSDVKRKATLTVSNKKLAKGKGLEYYKKDKKGKFKKVTVKKLTWDPLPNEAYRFVWKNKPKHIGVNTLDGAKIVEEKGSYVKVAGRKGKHTSYWLKKSDVEKWYSGFETGGYTGAWNGQNGKLALLHQKEIVLNKQDTANFLQAVKLTRMFAQDLGKYKTGLVDKITAISNNNKLINTNTSTQSQALQQDININATFPNVSSSSEIEKAFQQLSAKATQYAWSNKIK